DFDVIVVGAGVAGTTAATRCAQKGLNTLLVDRAKPIGSKNLSGGVLWGHDLDEVFPNWWKEGPVERPITQKGVGMLTKESAFNISFGTEEWKREPYNAFAVLRARFDLWLSEQAQKQGVMVVDGVNVEHLAIEDVNGIRTVKGVQQAGETITGDCVILADGCNSRLSMDLGVRGKLDRHNYVTGVKQIIKFPSQQALEDRFGLGPNEGVAFEYVLGYLENGAKAGGFLYTNKDTVSLGVIVNLDSIWEKGVYNYKIMEQFRLHAEISRLLRGGELVEYGAHLVPVGQLECVPQLFGPGWMICGDAAGFVYSNGLVIHGMNYAIKSGILAADAAVMAKKEGEFSERNLSVYKRLLDDSYIMADFKKLDSTHEWEWHDMNHFVIPKLAEGVMKGMFTATGEPKELTEKRAIRLLKEHKVSPIQLAKFALKARKSV
ncbi:MAG TPA: FAD-dependent oxidoreductase, partial [Candidatus Thermoplasmatota archaeon]|nr:FAD-dependent oxidoreductase [Candidatus Thermoplasmatota archaeon]